MTLTESDLLRAELKEMRTTLDAGVTAYQDLQQQIVVLSQIVAAQANDSNGRLQISSEKIEAAAQRCALRFRIGRSMKDKIVTGLVVQLVDLTAGEKLEMAKATKRLEKGKPMGAPQISQVKILGADGEAVS